MDKNIVGSRIRIARLLRKPVIRQKDLLAKLDLEGIHFSESTISKIESGSRIVTDIELVAIAKALDVSTSWLLGEKKKK